MQAVRSSRQLSTEVLVIRSNECVVSDQVHGSYIRYGTWNNVALLLMGLCTMPFDATKSFASHSQQALYLLRIRPLRRRSPRKVKASIMYSCISVHIR